MSRTVHTYCRVCEPACGLLATLDQHGVLERLQADKSHPISKGFACPRGTAGVDIHHDPDRLNFPLRRSGGALERSSWDDATADIARRLQSIVDDHGPDAVAVYMGNPASFNSLLGIAMPELFRRLGATRSFGAGTQDCANKFAASAAVFGTRALHPLPDVRNADAIMLLGSNWRTSKGSFISMPNAYKELMEAAARGARIWLVNPRETETAGDRTGETVAVKPETDVYFLAAVLHEIERHRGFHRSAEARGRNLDGLRSFIADYPADRVAPVCGVPAEQIREVALAFADAPRAAVHMSTGVNQSRQGTLAYWLMQMLSLVTGNLDEEGGNIPGEELYPQAAKASSVYDRDLVDGEFGPVFRGDLPGAVMADYILDAASPIRALFVIAGNPLLTIPGEERLREAFEQLELLVTLDIYPNATSEHAHWLLPATDQFERADFNISLLGMQAQAFLNWTPRVTPAQHERREEWWILARIAQQMGLPSLLDAEDPEEARWSRLDHMLAKGGITRAEVQSNPYGVHFGEGLHPGRLFTELIQSDDRRVDCRPAAFDRAIERCAEIFDELASESPDQLKLISRRDSRMQNSWYSNVAGMKRGKRSTNRLAINPRDAEVRSIEDGSRVVVRTEWGELETEVEYDERLREGVVSMEHGWGLQPSLSLSRERPGVNVNAILPHGPGSYDPLSNQARLTGVPVDVVPVR